MHGRLGQNRGRGCRRCTSQLRRIRNSANSSAPCWDGWRAGEISPPWECCGDVEEPSGGPRPQARQEDLPLSTGPRGLGSRDAPADRGRHAFSTTSTPAAICRRQRPRGPEPVCVRSSITPYYTAGRARRRFMHRSLNPVAVNRRGRQLRSRSAILARQPRRACHGWGLAARASAGPNDPTAT